MPQDAPSPTAPLRPDRATPAASRLVTLFSAGDLIANRFTIVRFIAQGGMGEVYEAEDNDLGRRIALKSLRPDVTIDERMVERFKREIQLATTITHKNICRIYDIGRHVTTEGETFTFLTMELVLGETLAERLKRTGRFSTEEALPLVRQMASALDAAHRAGVIHRDFKSANLILSPQVAGDGSDPDLPDCPFRVVVTDFGLARSSTRPEREALTGLAQFVGTPEYMAPEQVTGRVVTAETDIYSMGVVLYEMVSGRPPFLGDTPLSTAAKRLDEPPPPLHVAVPDIPLRWEAAILRCLERDPRRRFAKASDVVRFLEGRPSSSAVPAPDPPTQELLRVDEPGPWRSRAVRGVLGGALALAIAGAIFVATRDPAVAPTPIAPRRVSRPLVPARRSIAFLGFRNLANRPEEDWLSTALAEMLNTEIGAGEKLRTIPGENVATMRQSLRLPETDGYSTETLARIRKNLGCDLLVLGSFLASGPEGGRKVRLDLKVQDATLGETIVTLQESGSEADLPEMVARVGRLLRQKLDAGELSYEAAGALRAALPKSAEAARHYSEGLSAMRAFDVLKARQRLESAILAEPGFPLAHAALAEAWSALGHDARAAESARKAYDLAEKLSKNDRLWVTARYGEYTHEWTKAIDTYRSLWSLHPDDVDCALRLASAQIAASKAKDALATVDTLRALPPPASDDARIDLAEARAFFALSDLARLKVVAEKAIEKGEAQGKKLLVADARWLFGLALRDLGEVGKAIEAFEATKRLYAELGDRAGAARASNSIGVLKWRQGQLDESRRIFEEFLATSRELGYETGTSWALSNLADVTFAQGDLPGARKRYEEARVLFQEIGNQKSAASASASLAWVLYIQGDLAGARAAYEKTLPVMRQSGARSGTGLLLASLGTVLLAQGEVPAAKERLEEAKALFEEIGQKSYTAESLQGLAGWSYVTGDLAQARDLYEKALALRVELEERTAITRVRLQLARLDVEEGKVASAEAPARAALAEYQASRQVLDEAFARVILAQALLGLGRATEAEAVAVEARSLAGRAGAFEVLQTARLAEGRIATSLGRTKEGRQLVEQVLDETRRSGHLFLHFQARLEALELDPASPAESRKALAALEREARAKGLGFVAQRAAQLGGGSAPGASSAVR